jgi:hypothetical protein
VRLVAEFDNLMLSHADRSRIIADEHRGRMSTLNGVFPGTVLVDGFAAGIWRQRAARGVTTLTIDLWPSAAKRASVRSEVRSEAGRLLAFAAPGGTHEIRFGPASG